MKRPYRFTSLVSITLAFQVGVALGDERRPNEGGGDRRESDSLELIDIPA